MARTGREPSALVWTAASRTHPLSRRRSSWGLVTGKRMWSLGRKALLGLGYEVIREERLLHASARYAVALLDGSRACHNLRVG